MKNPIPLTLLLLLTAATAAHAATADDLLTSATAKYEKHDLDGAIADCTKVIELNPGYADAYNNRGAAKQAKGDLNSAIKDFNKAIELNPDYTAAYNNRGYLRYDQQLWTDSLSDFRKALELDPADDYSRFRIWLLQGRLGESPAAATELKEYLATRKPQPNDWPASIAQFLTGQLTEEAFLKAAQNPDPQKQNTQLCEAWFYAGSKHLLANDQETARTYFQKCLATNAKTYTEYASAAAELHHLPPAKTP